MKKLFILMLLLFPFISVGQHEVNLEEVNIDASTESLASIGKDGGMSLIQFGFCNEGINNTTQSINAAVEQGKPFEVCLLWKNNSNQDIDISVELPFGTRTKQGDKTCGIDYDFHNFVKGIQKGEVIHIPSGNHIIKKINILFPIGIDGAQNACLGYYIENKDLKEGQSGLIPKMRRSLFMDFFVGQADNIKNEINISDINTYSNENNDIILNFNIKNIGNVENDISISGSISNIFGYNRDFSIVGGVVVPEEKENFEVNLGQIPTYKGLYNIVFNTHTIPHFSYDISQSNINPDILKEKDLLKNISYFEMPRMIVGVLILIILLLFLAFRKPKQKVVYVEKPTTK